MTPPAIDQFFQALIATIAVGDAASDAEQKFAEDLVSVAGMPDHQPFVALAGFDRFRRLGLSFLTARSALASSTQRATLLRIRSVRMSERLVIAQTLSWHHRYVLRERLRRLIDQFKLADGAGELELEMSRIAARYKKRSDDLLRPRHRAVHEFDHHDPLIRQLETLELLSLPNPRDASFVRAMVELKKDSARRAKAEVIANLHREEMRFLELSDEAFSEVFGMRRVWEFPPT